jgi:transposase
VEGGRDRSSTGRDCVACALNYGMQPVIRQAVPADLPSIERIVTDAFAHYIPRIIDTVPAIETFEPLVEALRRHVMAAQKLHADDTPVPVLAPGNGKTKTGRLWTYVRDDRPAGDQTPPAVWFAYTPDRKGEHPQGHLSKFTGTLQADGYAGFEQIYETGRIQEAACWAHVRRKFYDIKVAHKSLVAEEALKRIGELYAVESDINGRSPEERLGVRNARSRPLLESLKQWLDETLLKLSEKSDTAMAVRYALGRWESLMRYCNDGHLAAEA